MMKWFSLIAGGIIGTLARYLLSGIVYPFAGGQFPYGTLVVNLLGCFLIGLFAALSDEKMLFGPNMRLFLMAGFCGAFTTFSTFIFETSNLVKDGESLRALVNILASVTLGFLFFKAGVTLAKVI